MSTETQEMIKQVAAGDTVGAKESFIANINAKLHSAIEDKRIEIANDVFSGKSEEE
jgi:hypothetical protein